MSATTAKKERRSDRLRVLVIFGSPHSDGTTAMILRALLDSLPQNAVIDRFDCFERMPLPCGDCRTCHEKDGCALSDIDDFYESLDKADALVFATPVYNLSFPAPMKALIDRMQCYWSARFRRGIRKGSARPKKAVLITSCGSGSAASGHMVERQLKPVLTLFNARLVQTVHYSGADQGRPLRPYLEKASKAADLL